jgi:GDP-4-dehydro-6-deoxy-D-mannose reductase
MPVILITGAGGFVGGHLAPRLRAAHPGTPVVALRADVTDRAAMLAEVRQVQPTACFHLAAISNVAQARRDPDAVWQVNLHGTLNLAHALMDEAPSCTLVFASSADTYGASFASGMPVGEDVALAPLNAYGASKAAADLALGAMARDGLRVVRLRPFNHTGPGQSDAFVVAAFARQVARIEAGLQHPVLQVGDLAPRRDFLDVRDVCDAYVACVQAAPDLPPGAVLNLASGEERRVGDVLDFLLAEAGVTARIAQDHARLRPNDIPLARGDARRARDLLGWSPRIAWAQTLRDVLADWRARCRE